MITELVYIVLGLLIALFILEIAFRWQEHRERLKSIRKGGDGDDRDQT